MPGDFKSEYQKLNRAQKEAVDFIEGPLLVIAGPGTGKTQLLSLRAANILSKTDALAENILCLTFSESGAQEMRSRLIKMIGEDAYKITVSTYHSFGSEIIRRYPSYFDGGIALRPINELKADIIIRDIQKTISYASDLKSPEMVRSVAGLINEAKQALLMPEDILKVAESNLSFIKKISDITKPLTGSLRAAVKNIEAFKGLIAPEDKPLLKNIEPLSSIWNSELIEAIEETELNKKAKSLSQWKIGYLTKDDHDLYIAKGEAQNKKLIEFADIYKKYDERLKKDGLYDFADMILRSIEAIKKYDELRFNLQENYLYIMLDEYQDTNPAQAELIRLLTNNPASEGRPNVMAVGDDDQAIYAFQGAKHSNMLDFTKTYLNVKEITLSDNYRSAQPLIDLAGGVADQINERLNKMLNVSKNFKAVRKNPSEITQVNFQNEVEGYSWLAHALKHPKEEIAVISPKHEYLERAAVYSKEKDIPLSYERRENILEDPLINQLLNFLRLLIAINAPGSRLVDSLLSTVLNYDFWQLPVETVWQISWQAYEKREPWLNIMLKHATTRSIALMLMKLAANSLVYRYDFIIDQVLGNSDIVINDPKVPSSRSPFLEFYSDELTQTKLFEELMVIKEQFAEFNQDNTQPLMTTDLMEFIDQLISSEIRLTNNFSYGNTSSKVKLLTAHGAKGQEFDSVYLLSFNNETWGPRKGHGNYLSLPANLKFIHLRADDTDDERLRLLYVALTRARNKVIALSYNQSSSSKNSTPLKYLPTLATIKKEKVRVNLKPLWQIDQLISEIPTDQRQLLLKRLEKYSLSPTELNTFIDVRNAGPDSFRRQFLLRYPEPSKPRMDYGSAIHESLNWLQQSLAESGKVPVLSSLIAHFETSLNSYRLLDHDYEVLRTQGSKALSAYYQANLNSFSPDDISERDFRSDGVIIDGVRLSGKVDKLIINKKTKEITVVDYKTGKGYSSWENKPKLHLDRIQLYFYKLLIENSRGFNGYKVKGAILDFVEPDKNSSRLHNIELTYDEQEMKRVKKIIKAVWQHINDLDFPSIGDYGSDVKDMVRFEDDLISGEI